MKRNEKGQFLKGNKTRKYYPKINDKFGDFTVISENVEFTNDNKIKYIVKCSCGHEQSVRAYFLTTKRQTCCRKCSQRKAAYKFESRRNFIDRSHDGIGNFTKTCYSYFKNNAYRRDIEWDNKLTLKVLWDLFIKQNKKCKLSGLDIDFTENRVNSNVDFKNTTASLDRIDSKKPYTINNVQWVHKDINRMKWAFDEKYFIKLCKLIVNHDNFEPSSTSV